MAAFALLFSCIAVIIFPSVGRLFCIMGNLYYCAYTSNGDLPTVLKKLVLPLASLSVAFSKKLVTKFASPLLLFAPMAFSYTRFSPFKLSAFGSCSLSYLELGLFLKNGLSLLMFKSFTYCVIGPAPESIDFILFDISPSSSLSWLLLRR
jgi:hypothetical protein